MFQAFRALGAPVGCSFQMVDQDQAEEDFKCQGNTLGLYIIWWLRKDWGIQEGQQCGHVVLWEED